MGDLHTRADGSNDDEAGEMSDEVQAWKQLKEQFVSGGTGSSVSHINAVCVTAITTYALWLRTNAYVTPGRSSVAHQLASLVLPLALATLVSRTSLLVYANTCLALGAWLAPRWLATRAKRARAALSGGGQLSPKRAHARDASRGTSDSTHDAASLSARKPALTVYRAHMMLMTVICILAVDFPVFPRKHAKTEDWGTSLMDLGVGSFVYSLGLVNSLPLLRRVACDSSSATAPHERRQGSNHALVSALRALRRVLPVLILGLIRLAVVKASDYPEHVTEYGVHWNFFFTLAALPLAGSLVDSLLKGFSSGWRVDYSLLACVVSIVHEITLRKLNLQRWAFEADRTQSLLAANKEGVASLPGYVAIYFVGLATGLYVLPPEPYFYQRLCTSLDSRPRSQAEALEVETRRRKAWKEKPDKLIGVLASYAFVWWSLYALAALLFGLTPSRRLANFSYVCWVAAFNASFILGYVGVHHALAGAATPAPLCFEALNKNGLAVFLIANVLTGAVNMSVESIYTRDSVAVVILLSYLAAVFTFALYTRRWRIAL